MKTKTCTKCGATKPNAQFKRRLSLAQSRAVLRNPNVTTNYMADSTMCKSCQPKRKPPRKLTAKEIRTRITNGDIHPILGEAKLKQKREGINQGRSKVMKETWQKRKDKPFALLKRHLQDQLNRFGNRHFASKNLQDATRLQNAHNYEHAKLIMADLLDRASSGETIPHDVQIASLIPPLTTKE